jgi:N utilization substance protein B
VAGSDGTNMARLISVQSLYEMEITGASIDDVVLGHIENRWAGQWDDDGEIKSKVRKLARTDRKKFAKIVRGVTRERERLDAMVTGALAGDYEAERLDIILRIILRVGAFEMYSQPRVPARVTISEYVDIAKAFYDEGEAALVNGILDRIARLLRPAELGPLEDSAAGKSPEAAKSPGATEPSDGE